MNLEILPRDDCLGDQRQFEEERDSKFSWALTRKIKWANFIHRAFGLNADYLPLSLHIFLLGLQSIPKCRFGPGALLAASRSHHIRNAIIFHRRLSDHSLLYSWTTTDCGNRIRATNTNICTLLHVPAVSRVLGIARDGNGIREALSGFPQMLRIVKPLPAPLLMPTEKTVCAGRT